MTQLPKTVTSTYADNRYQQVIDIFNSLELTLSHVYYISRSNKFNPYHNEQHLFTVVIKTAEAAAHYNLDKEERKILALASLYHDASHSGDGTIADSENIEDACATAKAMITSLEANPTLLKEVIRLIQATNTDFALKDTSTLLEKIIRDADVLQCLQPDGQLWMDGLSIETGKNITIESTKEFLNSHPWYTKWGRKEFDQWII